MSRADGSFTNLRASTSRKTLINRKDSTASVSNQMPLETDSRSSKNKRKPSRHLKSIPLKKKLCVKGNQIGSAPNTYSKQVSSLGKGINLHKTLLYTSDSSSSDDYSFDSNLPTTSRKTRNREYALNTSIQNKSLTNVTPQISDIDLICTSFEKKLCTGKCRNEGLHTSIYADSVVREVDEDNCESLNSISNEYELSSSSSSLTELDMELIKPHVHEIETLSSSSLLSSTIQEQEHDAFVDHIIPPSLPDLDNRSNRISTNESNILMDTTSDSSDMPNINVLGVLNGICNKRKGCK